MSIEKNTPSVVRAALLAAGILCAVPAMAQDPGGCSTPAAPGTAVPLGLDTGVVSTQGSDEWNSEVIKVMVDEPGLLAVTAEGPEAQGSVYTPDPLGGAPELLGGRGIGTAGLTLAMVVEPGEYCVRIIPPAGTTASLRVQAELIGLVSIPE
ncbi:MAG TPA: hypothetical protein VNW71_03355 [Thermoanaerobaculia bacterium]|nr:hypothetical protein [Thermoanaerobaculia bacterium]